jgi:hypothetical protein
MTHDDLIAKMDDLDIALSNGFGKAETIIGSIKAVRAVIELHTPVKKPYMALFCAECDGYADFPCATIQAIAKELE